MMLYLALVMLLLLIGMLADQCYKRGIRETEERYSAILKRQEKFWSSSVRQWQQEVEDHATALAPYGQQLLTKLPREGNEPILVPFYDFIAMRAAMKSVSRFTHDEGFAFHPTRVSINWRAHRLEQGPRR